MRIGSASSSRSDEKHSRVSRLTSPPHCIRNDIAASSVSGSVWPGAASWAVLLSNQPGAVCSANKTRQDLSCCTQWVPKLRRTLWVFLQFECGTSSERFFNSFVLISFRYLSLYVYFFPHIYLLSLYSIIFFVPFYLYFLRVLPFFLPPAVPYLLLFFHFCFLLYSISYFLPFIISFFLSTFIFDCRPSFLLFILSPFNSSTLSTFLRFFLYLFILHLFSLFIHFSLYSVWGTMLQTGRLRVRYQMG